MAGYILGNHNDYLVDNNNLCELHCDFGIVVGGKLMIWDCVRLVLANGIDTCRGSEAGKWVTLVDTGTR